MKWIGRPVAEISPLETFPTWRWPPSWICLNRKYSAVRFAVSENTTLEPNMKLIGSTVAEIWPFAYVGGIWNPFWGRGGRRGSTMAPFTVRGAEWYEAGLCDRDVAGSTPARGCCVPTPTQRAIPLGSVDSSKVSK